MAPGRNLGRDRETLLKILSSLTGAEPAAEGIYASICQTVVENLPVDSCSVFIYDVESSSLRHVASHGRQNQALLETEDIRLKVNGNSRFSRCLKGDFDPVILEEGEADPLINTAGFQRVIAFPLVSAGESLGIIAFASLPGSPVPRDDDLDILREVAAVTAAVALRFHLQDEFERSEERYTALMEGARDLVFVLDGGGRFLYVNPRCRDMLGYEPEEMLGRYFGEFVTGESWAGTVSALRSAAAGKARFLDYQWVIPGKDGRMLTLDVRASIVVFRGEILRHQGIARDISQERALHEELARRGQELSETRSNEERMRGYLSVATLAQEEERARVARELHDGPVQYLVAMRRQLDLFRKLKDGEEREKVLNDMDSLLEQAVRDLREFSRNLRPPVLDDFGLTYAVEWLAEQVEKSGIKVKIAVEGEPRRLGREIEIACFRITQEALANAMKHSGASMVEITLSFGADAVGIRVSDDGQGFSPPDSLTSLARAGQMGLVGMHERAELLGGSISIRSEPLRGTSVIAEIPLTT